MPSIEAIAAWWPALGLPVGIYALWWSYRLAGWRGVVVLLTAGLAFGLYRKGAADERAKVERDAAAARSKAIKERQAVNAEIHQLDDDTVDADLAKWLRDGPR